MKKIIPLISLMTSLACIGYSQSTTHYGDNAGTGGGQSSFFGKDAGHNSKGYFNTAVGASALMKTTYGEHNTALGFAALKINLNGQWNTATGAYSLTTNRDGNFNTATGTSALYTNWGGDNNTAIGSHALYTNLNGNNNTANGYRALYKNTGSFNTAIGGYCMKANVNGNLNTGIGYYAMANNTTGARNSAEGFRALDHNTTGSYNTAEGARALNYVSTGSYNSALGYDAGPTLVDLNNTTAIGYLAVPTASNQVRIGNASVTSIGGQVGWTAFSDGRFKKDIKEDVSGLEFINELRPVSYTVDKAGLNKFLHVNDSSSNQAEAKSIPTRQTGFVAQEVEAIVKKTGYVFSGVDVPENENDPYGLRYAEFVVPLVKGMQELTAILKTQEQKIAAQEQKIDSLVNQLGSKSEIEKGMSINDHAVLYQNNPNPFNAETEIKMTVTENVGFATVMIYNLEGKQMKNIQVRDRGEVSIKISGSELSAGMYLYALIADGKVVDTKRMILTQ